jgi:hypothetical protein
MSTELCVFRGLFAGHPVLLRAMGVVLGCLLFQAGAFAGTAYQFEAPDGTIVFTDKPLPLPFKLVKQLELTWGDIKRRVPKPRLDAKSMPRNRDRFDLLIADTAQRHRLLPELLHAVIEAESAYDPNAVSHAGAAGLMQLMPKTAERFGVTDRFDPAQSLEGGASYLRFLIDHFDNDLMLAIAGYNAGENAVEKYGRTVPPYRETKGYVVKVLKFFRRNLATMRGRGAVTALNAD